MVTSMFISGRTIQASFKTILFSHSQILSKISNKFDQKRFKIRSCYFEYENKTLRLNGSIRGTSRRVSIVWYKHGQESIRLHELSQVPLRITDEGREVLSSKINGIRAVPVHAIFISWSLCQMFAERRMIF